MLMLFARHVDCAQQPLCVLAQACRQCVEASGFPVGCVMVVANGLHGTRLQVWSVLQCGWLVTFVPSPACRFLCAAVQHL